MQLRGAAGLAIITLSLSGCAPWLPMIQHKPAPSPSSTGPSGKIPITGQPSALFCENAGAYLSKFPDLPLYRPEPEIPNAMGTLSCMYTSDPSDSDRPRVILDAQAVKDDEDRAAFTELCDNGKLGPGTAKVTADWVKDRGWSAWIAAHDPTFSEAVLCTRDQFYEIWVTHVPGATADDALATIMAAVD
ncbi:hypothetical protein [Arthrobacter sp. ISL-5]|uniref:hypothetical protein n=1 Tax=Arthrobacter sp. ISL-5 TaxID=2819111 RepID=UPI001BE8152D|nr:hypothetical protein [Arthrobacter sp. ISL-5]MBT2551905.1 hypothetical protein [Arthrobacter sp. ISL-5]